MTRRCAAGDCIDVSLGQFGSVILQRKPPGHQRGSLLIVDRAEWDALVARIKAGELDDLTVVAP